MSPVPEVITSTSGGRLATIASREPATSALIIRFIFFSDGTVSDLGFWEAEGPDTGLSEITDPTSGVRFKPKISTGWEGKASVKDLPSKSNKALALPIFSV